MGMFSWVDVDGSQNITDEDEKVILLIPNEHKEAVSKIFGTPIEGNGIEGKYDGYGSVADKNGTESDAYDVMTFINICLTSEEQFNKICFYTSKLHPDECSPMKEVADEARQAYQNGEIKSIDDLEVIANRFGTEFRVIGITIGCYDEQNARLPYPMKWTLDESLTYENSLFSMSDPNQGFSKTRIADKLEELNEKRDEILAEIEQEQEQEYDDDRNADDDRCL
jgi:hypothetical protein